MWASVSYLYIKSYINSLMGVGFYNPMIGELKIINVSLFETKFRIVQSQPMVFLVSCFPMPTLKLQRGHDLGLSELFTSSIATP
jgi:hypothetical protein